MSVSVPVPVSVSVIEAVIVSMLVSDVSVNDGRKTAGVYRAVLLRVIEATLGELFHRKAPIYQHSGYEEQ